MVELLAHHLRFDAVYLIALLNAMDIVYLRVYGSDEIEWRTVRTDCIKHTLDYSRASSVCNMRNLCGSVLLLALRDSSWCIAIRHAFIFPFPYSSHSIAIGIFQWGKCCWNGRERFSCDRHVNPSVK